MTDDTVDEWTLDGVLDELARIHDVMKDRQFAFILGAGASVSSSIPTGGQLAQRWLEDLHRRECFDQRPLQEWIPSCGIGAGDLTWDTAAEHYPQIFERRFARDHEAGYAELEAAMEGKSPSLGYSLLAEIIQHTRHKVVVTTNFDNLVADALAMHAHQSPLVVAHESLAGFVRPQLRRPLVAKIHRDLFLHPLNDSAGVSTMEKGWKIALKKLFQYFTPVVVGYAGNDGSLMNMLTDLADGEIAGRMVWCYRDGAPPPKKARAVLRKLGGLQVKIVGFDEFMLQLAARLVKDFDVAAIAERTAELGQERAERYREQATKLRETSARGSLAQQKAGAVLDLSVRSGSSWWAWEMRARSAGGEEERHQIYRDGLQHFPNSAQLTGSYAVFLADRLKDNDGAEEMFEKALELDPSSALNARNYAVFLWRERKDYDRAEAMYRKGLELDPDDPEMLAGYGLFLANDRNNVDRAQAMYKRALELGSIDPEILGSYAVFQADKLKDYDGAEATFEKALELERGHVNNTHNYALFLQNERKDFDRAEALYKRALELDPRNLNHMVNYASLLLTRGDDVSLNAVLQLVRRALEHSPPGLSQPVAVGLLYGALVQEIVPEGEPGSMLARLKGALLAGYPRGSWNFSLNFSAILARLPADRLEFFLALGLAIQNEERLQVLDAMEPWHKVHAIDPLAP